jgi:hypothetical protein
VLTIQLRFPQSSGWVRNNFVCVSPANPDEPLVRVRDNARLLSNEANRAAVRADFLKPLGPDHQIDLHLAATASAINAGVILREDVPVDCEGRLRSTGKTWDVGAYELPGR